VVGLDGQTMRFGLNKDLVAECAERIVRELLRRDRIV
jgi:adenylylsulfate kinase-like enzyme